MSEDDSLTEEDIEWSREWCFKPKMNAGLCCPACGAKEAETASPRTIYACESSDYDQRPSTFDNKCQIDWHSKYAETITKIHSLLSCRSDHGSIDNNINCIITAIINLKNPNL